MFCFTFLKFVKLLDFEAWAHGFWIWVSGSSLSSSAAPLIPLYLSLLTTFPRLTSRGPPSWYSPTFLEATSAGSSSPIHFLNVTVSPKSLISNLSFFSVYTFFWMLSFTHKI